MQNVAMDTQTKELFFPLLTFENQIYGRYWLKLRKEMGNVSKRQQPDHRADNIQITYIYTCTTQTVRLMY